MFPFISGPVLVMVLEKVNAIADWRALIGPTDARKAKVAHPYRYYIFSFDLVSLCSYTSNLYLSRTI